MRSIERVVAAFVVAVLAGLPAAASACAVLCERVPAAHHQNDPGAHDDHAAAAAANLAAGTTMHAAGRHECSRHADASAALAATRAFFRVVSWYEASTSSSPSIVPAARMPAPSIAPQEPRAIPGGPVPRTSPRTGTLVLRV